MSGWLTGRRRSADDGAGARQHHRRDTGQGGGRQPVVKDDGSGDRSGGGVQAGEDTEDGGGQTPQGNEVEAVRQGCRQDADDQPGRQDGRAEQGRPGGGGPGGQGHHRAGQGGQSQALEAGRSAHAAVQDDRTAGLGQGQVDVAIRRGSIEDTDVMVEHLFDEPRFAAVPARSALADSPQLQLEDLVGETIVLVPGVGTTTLSLWPQDQRPRNTLPVANIDEWLLAISSTGAVGVTPESTAWQHPHPGVRYVPLPDAPVVPVSLLTAQAHPHPAVPELADLVRRCLAGEPRSR